MCISYKTESQVHVDMITGVIYEQFIHINLFYQMQMFLSKEKYT